MFNLKLSMSFFKKYFSSVQKFDWILFGSVFLLISFGLSAIYSIAISSSEPDLLNFKKQIVFALISIVVLFVLSSINYHLWHDFSFFVYLAGIFFLVLVLFLGRTIKGTTGWFSLFGINFQPVEAAKAALIIFLSWFLSVKSDSIKEFKNFIIAGLITLVYFGLIILQPDFGSGMILFFVWLVMMIFAGANKKHLGLLGLGLVIIAIIAWIFFFADYQKGRIKTFIDPQADPYNTGYHVRQAVTAVGAGGIFGRGLGFGSQSQLKFIPAAETDFIFAVIAEELGFLGICLVLFFFGLVFYRLTKAIKLMKDSFSQLFIFGVLIMIFCQIMINIGMNIGIVPVTGISLPFLSYGGSYLLITLALIGIIENMIIRNRN